MTKNQPQPQPPKRNPRSADYGKEGTNKTRPLPRPDATSSEVLPGTPTKFTENSPYTRG